MATITITEGLSQLKNLTNRISKEISNAQFVSVYQTGKTPAGFKTVDEFVGNVKSSFQSINDLIARRDRIKTAIVGSNAVTNVTIAGKPYTVAGAIERKSSVELQKQLLSVLSQQNSVTAREFERRSAEVQTRLDSLLEQSLGKDVKTNPEDVKNITDNFMSRNEYKLCDPINVKTLIETMSNDINDFLTNVDVALSISNATTTIEVD